MKKKCVLIIIIVIVLLLALFGLFELITNNKEESVITYETVTLDNYTFKVNSDYNYKYDEEENAGYFDNNIFFTSLIYVCDESYSDLIRYTGSYTVSSSEMLDSSMEETTFNGYDAYINIKKEYYIDNDTTYYLVIIIINLDSEECLVLQYETSINNEYDAIFESIKEGLNYFNANN